MKISTARNLADFDLNFQPKENETNFEKIRFRKAMTVGNFDKCVGMWTKRAREDKTILGLDNEAVLRLEYF